MQPIIDVSLVHRLITSQFPEWQGLPITPVEMSGWDNRTFHLGNEMSVRLPSAADYALQVEKEQEWLPKLAPALPVSIPIPLAIGKPECGYPWKWSIYRWIEGKTVTSSLVKDLVPFASDLAGFLKALHRMDATGGPPPGLHSFSRGGALSIYDADTRRAIHSLKGKMDERVATDVWEKALSTSWKNPPVWVHGDISAGNLLVQDGKLCAVIDFGQLAIGDPACDLAINWTLFHGESRAVFQKDLSLDEDTWGRARGWTLWKALVVAAGFTNPRNTESKQCWRIIEDLIVDHQSRT